MSMPEVGELVTMLELRDYFAARAMQAILSSDMTIEINGKIVTGEMDTAKAAYIYADAMLKAREK